MYIVAEFNYNPQFLQRIVEKFEDLGISSRSLRVSFVDDIRDLCGCSNDPTVRRVNTHHYGIPKEQNGDSYKHGTNMRSTSSTLQPIMRQHHSLNRSGSLNAVDLFTTKEIKTEIVDDAANTLDMHRESNPSSLIPSTSATDQLAFLKPKSHVRERDRNDSTTKSTAEMLSDLENYKRCNRSPTYEICKVCFCNVDLGRRPAVHGAVKLEHAKTHLPEGKQNVGPDDVSLMLLTEECFPFNKTDTYTSSTSTVDVDCVAKNRKRSPNLEDTDRSDVIKKKMVRNRWKGAHVLDGRDKDKHVWVCKKCGTDVNLGRTISLNAICDRMVIHVKSHLDDLSTAEPTRTNEMHKSLLPMISECFPEMNIRDSNQTLEEIDGHCQNDSDTNANGILRSLVEDAINNAIGDDINI